MKERIAYEDAVDLLDADHKAVKKMFIDHAALCADDAPAATRHLLALRICAAATVHAQLEEEIFYPQVRAVIGDHPMLAEAQRQHAEVEEAIERIGARKATDAGRDPAVQLLGGLIDRHVLDERERIFLKARQAPLDLRRMTLPLLQRRRQLQKHADADAAKVTA